jgi:membrane carboxypeptidase/penicillin-binding protein PbpC
MDPHVAWLISDILSDNYARAPTFTTHSILQIGWPAAVKTGTTTDFRDNWTVGYTPNLAVGVWVGNADNSGMVTISGISGAGPIWHSFMREALNGQPELEFKRPPGLTQAEVCALSGMLPTLDCPATIREWFIDGTQPTQRDTFYRRVALDAATGLPADSATPPERRVEKVLLNLPPGARAWAVKNGLALATALTPWPPLPEGEGENNQLMVVSPDPESVYQISPTLPIEAQKLKIAAVGSAGVRDVTILLDGVPLARFDAPPFEAWWVIAEGKHEVYAEGIDAEGKTVRSEAVTFTVRPAGG